MAEIIRASEMGFCMGVRRAVHIMEDEATPENPIASAGEIVHNPHVVEQLERTGVRQLPGPDEVEGDFGAITAERVGTGRIAITAHGVGERVLRDLEDAGLNIIDTTCPVVTRAQRFAQKFVRDKWHALIFGDPGHKEVRGIIGWAMDEQGRSQVTVVEHANIEHLRELIETFPGGFPNKIGVMAQTTHKMDDFAQLRGQPDAAAARGELRDARGEHPLPRHHRPAGGRRRTRPPGRRDGGGRREEEREHAPPATGLRGRGGEDLPGRERATSLSPVGSRAPTASG